jgi:hypothetical protein
MGGVAHSVPPVGGGGQRSGCGSTSTAPRHRPVDARRAPSFPSVRRSARNRHVLDGGSRCWRNPASTADKSAPPRGLIHRRRTRNGRLGPPRADEATDLGTQPRSPGAHAQRRTAAAQPPLCTRPGSAHGVGHPERSSRLLRRRRWSPSPAFRSRGRRPRPRRQACSSGARPASPPHRARPSRRVTAACRARAPLACARARSRS